MLLEVLSAKYIQDYRVSLKFNDGYVTTVDLGEILLNEKRKIFKPLLDKKYFKNFSVRLNTICWENEADFAPEFLCELAKRQADLTTKARSGSAST
ncbi:MAG: DUF2442 domain-containing protein [Candidatus Aminicenantes bacterium]|nr:DUF2442 domain-containing protein [Candidatus Aminicenantes bacterium]